ncbi:tape measure protein [Salipaludibacillus agaradhaerens]|uniref:tape measure protein n=1 Tax=Salipaludibacillus TaxID=1884449 RepID=UPI0020D00174|nr:MULTISPECIES: tape measure protein [Salipaludibacillus]MCR6116632.1 tape measure protein [Salipaludibacillus agaradhaerens]UTR13490.1 tape measure protein [Salipaludibacillus sp. LMS25]
MADGKISISIEVDGKQVNVAAKELERLEESGLRTGKGIKAAEGSMDSLSDSSAKTASSVRGAEGAIDALGDSGANTSRDLKGAEGAIDGLGDSSSKAGSSVKGAGDAIDGLGDSGADASKSLKGAEGSIDGLADSSADASSSVKGVSDSLDGVSDDSQQASGDIKKFATAIGLVAIAAAAFGVLKSSMDDAISRFDTLNQFPKVLQALGVSAEESEQAMSKLSDGIDGLPTKLDEIASNAQRMYTSFGNMDEATDTALALNNALLGSGASAAQAQRGTEQYIKALQTGQFDMNTWNTLSETMDVGLVKIAESFGYAGKSAKDDLYRALQDGTVTLDDFNDKLIEVGTGTGIMAELAKENSLGIATSLGNLQNAAARGIANIIDSLNKLAEAVTGKDIAQNIDSLKDIVMESFNLMSSAIEATTPVVKLFASAISAAIPVVQALSPAIIGLVTAYAAYTVITKASAAIQASNAVLKVAMGSTQALTLATKAQMTAQFASTTATKAQTVAMAAQSGTIKLSTLAMGVMTGQIGLLTAAKVIGTAAATAFGVAIRFMLGPIGWVTAGIGLLVTAVIGVVKWFNRTSKEAERLNDEVEELGGSTQALNDSVDSSSEAYKANQTEINASAKANDELAKKIEELADKENKSASEKAMLNSYIEELNGSVEGLNLAYSEEADALSMSSEELQARIDLMKEQETAQEAQSRLTEILKEQAEVEEKLAETNALREEWNEKLEEGSVKGREHKKAIEELDEQEELLKETNAELALQYEQTEEQMTTSIEAITEATENGVSNQIIAFEDLSESQQATVDSMKSTWEDYKDAATDMFDTLSDEAELTVEEMTANLEENQRIIGEWAEGIATLAERGVDEGLLETLRDAGPESAGHVNALVNASDEELEGLSEAFSKGGETATDALSKSLGIEESGVMEAVGHLVSDTEDTLSQQIESADFKSIGNAVPDGLADGIDQGSKNAENSSKQMADDTTDAAKKALGVNSPSRVFMDIGTNVTEGLVLGINNGTSKVIQAVQKMFDFVLKSSDQSFQKISKNHDKAVKDIENSLNKLPVITHKAMSNMMTRLSTGTRMQLQLMQSFAKGLIRPFNRLPSDFNNIGRNAMSGLNAGLNAGRGQVMSTARNIANSVANTMQKALKINSPSRLMRDDVGKWIPEGIAVGIRDNAKSVYKELDNLSNGMIMTSTPEAALGTSRMRYASGGNQIVNALKNFQSPASGGSNRTYSPNINNYFTPAESTPSESAKKQKQQQQRLAMEWGFR